MFEEAKFNYLSATTFIYLVKLKKKKNLYLLNNKKTHLPIYYLSINNINIILFLYNIMFLHKWVILKSVKCPPKITFKTWTWRAKGTLMCRDYFHFFHIRWKVGKLRRKTSRLPPLEPWTLGTSDLYKTRGQQVTLMRPFFHYFFLGYLTKMKIKLVRLVPTWLT